MKMLTFLLCICLITACSTGQIETDNGPDRIACTITDDFETGELYAWESYPYAQDIGYDPGITCQKEPTHNGSRFALARIIEPNDALDLSQGFTKQIDLWSTHESHLKCALFLMSDRRPEKIELFLGLYDGRLYAKTILNPEANRWIELDIPTGEFLKDGAALGAGEHIQVAAIKAFYPLVSHLMSYTILMDDFSINGSRQRQFIAHNPTSTYFDKFGVSILNKHYYAGEPISVSVSPEDGRKVTDVDCSVLGPDGAVIAQGVRLFDDGSNGDAQAGDNIWTNNAVHTITSSDPRGQWSLDLTGKTGGNDVRWSLRFIMPGNRLTAENHPRLFFTGDEISVRLASDEPAHVRKILDNALSGKGRYANVDIDDINEDVNVPDESLTGGPYSQVGVHQRQWINPAYTLAGIAEHGAWQYALGGNEEEGLRAKEALIKFCRFKAWNRSWMEAHGRHIYFPVGYMTKRVAIAYDLLFPMLSEEEKQIVRDGIMRNAIKPFYRDMVEMNRMPSSLSNHIAVIVSGLSLAATAIYGDDPGNPSLEPYLSGILVKMKDFIDKTYFPEGSYGEPYTYQAMATRDLTEALYAMERNFGIDYTSTTDMKDLYIYPLYATHANGRYQDFGDVSLWYGMTQTHFQWLTYKMKNPWAYGYVKPFWESGRGGFMGYLWYTDGITPRYRDELPTSKLFAGKGNMIMRSDWKDDGSIMIFKCGPNSNHYHLDQGTFVIMTNGQELLSDAGHSSGYYSNLYYPCYYTQAIGHNVMLVDKNPESQGIADYENGVAALRDYPQITSHFASDIADNVEGDLTCVYKGELSSYTRSLLYMKPEILYVYDKASSKSGHEYNWLFHAEHSDGGNAITYKDNRVTITRSKANLTMDVISPRIASHTIRDSDRDESFIMLSGEEDQTETAFLAVLSPTAGTKPTSITSTLIEGDGWIGARSVLKSTIAVGMFSSDGREKGLNTEAIYADAERCAVVMDKEGRVERYFIHGQNMNVSGKRPAVFHGNTSVSAAVLYGVKGHVDLDIEAPEGTSVSFSVYRKPSTVILNDAESDIWQYDEQTKKVALEIPAGRTKLRIR